VDSDRNLQEAREELFRVSSGIDQSKTVRISVLVQRELDFLVDEHKQYCGFLPKVLASCQKGFSHFGNFEGKSEVTWRGARVAPQQRLPPFYWAI